MSARVKAPLEQERVLFIRDRAQLFSQLGNSHDIANPKLVGDECLSGELPVMFCSGEKIFSGAMVSYCAERLRVDIQRRSTAVNEGREAHGVLG